jgi:AAA+ superfamily predicted ATPase
MTDVDINLGFESKARLLYIDKGLEEIVKETSKITMGKARSVRGVSSEEFSLFEKMLPDFLCSYVAINNELEQKDIFNKEKNYKNAIKIFSLYSASKAMLNKLNDEKIEQIRSYDLLPNQTDLAYTDIGSKMSDLGILSSVLKKLQQVNGTNSNSLKYGYFIFFDKLKDICKNQIRTNFHPNTISQLNEVRIFKTGLDFHEPVPKREFNKELERSDTKTTNIEQLPTELPVYEPNRRAKLENIIGNEQAKEKLRAAIIRVLTYDSAAKLNPFRDSADFADSFLVYGDPGVGKNYTIDALLNHFKDLAPKLGKQVEFVDLSQGLRSMYKDRSAQILQKYISLQNQGEKTYVNIIDEADGIFTLNERGEQSEESKKLLTEMKKAINNSDKGNSLFIFMTNYAEKFEAALKQRFIPIEMKGPTSPEHFSHLLKQELGSTSLNDKQIYKLGEKIYGCKQQLSNTAPFTGRDVKKLVAPFISGDDATIIANETALLSAQTGQIKSLLPKLNHSITYERLSQAIDLYVNELKNSTQQTTARYV